LESKIKSIPSTEELHTNEKYFDE
jgi:hypothetical protein